MLAPSSSPPALRRRCINNEEEDCDAFAFHLRSPRRRYPGRSSERSDNYVAKGHSHKHGLNGHRYRRIVALAVVLTIFLLSIFSLAPEHDEQSQLSRMVRRSLIARDARPFTVQSEFHFQHQWLVTTITLPSVSISRHRRSRNSYSDDYMSTNNQNGRGALRRIDELDDQRQYERAREAQLEEMNVDPDGLESYYRNREDLDPGEPCRRNSMRSLRFQNCNTFHEKSLERPPMGSSSLQQYNVTYRGSGSFRLTWLFHSILGDEFVLKVLRYHSDFDYKAMADMNNEAVVLERLSGSPRIVDIFGNCGFSIAAENMEYELTKELVPGSDIDYSKYGYMNQSELDTLQVSDVRPQNSLTVHQKLDYAIVMAEAIADIHGFSGGVIVHGDIHPVQFLKNRAGMIKLNDFNNGEILKFDYSRKDYCDEWRCYGGTYRPPEELLCDETYSNEAVDIWPMGNNIYCLLTGLWPYYEYGSRQDRNVIQRIRHCETPTVDVRYRNRSAIEGGLVRIMERTWECDYKKRLSIFDVVQQLYELREHAMRIGYANDT